MYIFVHNVLDCVAIGVEDHSTTSLHEFSRALCAIAAGCTAAPSVVANITGYCWSWHTRLICRVELDYPIGHFRGSE